MDLESRMESKKALKLAIPAYGMGVFWNLSRTFDVSRAGRIALTVGFTLAVDGFYGGVGYGCYLLSQS